jgi:hypothetical protein
MRKNWVNKIVVCGIILLFVGTSVGPSISSDSRIKKISNQTNESTPLTSMAANWTETQKLLASNGEVGDCFGVSVSVDGDSALIGADWDDDNGVDSGSAYVFTRTGTIWTQQAKLLASDGAAGDWFGCSVSLDRGTALIGAPRDDDNGVYAGSVYVFTYTGTTWTQQAKLLASDGAAEDWFGWSVSLDGDTAIIGAMDDDDNGTDSGSVYVYTRTGNTWTVQAKLIASDGAVGKVFGSSVSFDGDTALIGAFGEDNGTGSAYVFTRTGTTWTQQAKLLASDGAAWDWFGVSVSLDGDTALIGASGFVFSENFLGSVYVFTRTGTSWTQQAKLLTSDGAAGDYFGYSVSLAGDTAFIGAWSDDDNGSSSGSAYVFTRIGSTWTQQAKLLASGGAAGDYFGYSVSLAGDTTLIGAYGDENLAGSAYVFTKENQPPNPPTITGPASGKKGQPYNYTFNTTDPNGDNVYYFIDWGDNTSSGWIGPYSSGHEITQSHTWSKGTYTIKAKAKDMYGSESSWATLTVTMPNDLAYIPFPFLQILEKLMERFPHAFPILRELLGY